MTEGGGRLRDQGHRFVSTIAEGAELDVKCHRGCTACCHDAPTGVSAPELLLAYRASRGLPDALNLHNQACTLSDLLFAEVGRRLGLEGLSPVLFRGLAELGGRVFRERPLIVTGAGRGPRPRSRGRRGKKRPKIA